MRRLQFSLLGLVAFLVVSTSGQARDEIEGPYIVQLRSEGMDASAWSTLQTQFERRNPGYSIRHHPELRELSAAAQPQVIFVQGGEATARVAEQDSPVTVGDLIVLRPGEQLRLDSPIHALAFETTDPLGSHLPTFLRPDYDPRMTDTPGGCAEEEGAYRRILLTWLESRGPYTYHALNTHRVRIHDSFTHYHPLKEGFDEFYLVQHASEGASLLTSPHLDKITHPEILHREEISNLLQRHSLKSGDLVYMPRGLIHRGLHGVLAHVIAVPGFRPGAELGVDEFLRTAARRLDLKDDELPYHRRQPAADLAQRTEGFVHFLDQPGQEANLLGLKGSQQNELVLAQRIDTGRYAAILPYPPASSRPTLTPSSLPNAIPRVTTQRRPHSIRLLIDDTLVTEYHFGKDLPRPFFYPLHGPDHQPFTRSWPMAEGPDEAQDHPHHRSFWFAFGDVNGHDFWSENQNHGTIRHLHVTDLRSGPVFASLTAESDWVAFDGTVLLREQTTARLYAFSQQRILDLEISLRARSGDVVFGDTKEGMMAVRVAPQLRLEGSVATGAIRMSSGHRDQRSWGKRASWCDYSGVLGEQTYGIALFDHPDNLRHPTWWHARGYGLCAANPFGLHYFEGKSKGAGAYTLRHGDRLHFRYRLYLHRESAADAAVEEHYQAFWKQ
jgi:hypothetical protein